MRRPRILVVDDEADMRAMLDAVLRRAGFEVEQAPDGQDALRAVLARPPDLVVTDILMPRVDGWELCRRLRADRRTARIPIIFLSLRNGAADRTYGLELGADDFLAKPFDTRELTARVQAVLKRSLAARAPEAPEGAVTGNLRDMSLVDIAQVLDLGRKTAAIQVASGTASDAGEAAGSGRGALYFKDGAPVHAQYGDAVGPQALLALIALVEGRFEIVLGASAPRRTLEGSTQEVLLDAVRRLDERRGRAPARTNGPRPPPAPRADGPAAPAVPRAPGGLEPTLLDLFALGVIEPKG